MTYTQLRDAIWKIPYVGGLCLKYVEDAFRTDHPYNDAVSPVEPGQTGAWDSNYGGGNHPGELPPKGVTVPIYFSLGSTPAGHVAISLSDGTVASSTQSGKHTQGFIHPNLQNLIDVYAKYNDGCTYLGWSEYVGTVRVVAPVNQPSQGGDTMAIIQDTDNWYNRCNITHNEARGEDLDRGVFKSFVGTDFLHFAEACQDAPEAQIARTWMTVGKTAVTDNWQGQITDLQAQLKAEQAKGAGLATNLADVNGRLDTATKANSDKDAALAADEAKITDLANKVSTLTAQADKPPVENPTGTVAPQSTSTPPTSTPPQTPTRPQTFTDWLVSLFKGSR